MPGVFISYRREDSSGQAGRLFDILSAHFGRDRIFMDLDTIRGGDNFVTVIEEHITRCDVLLAIIGERWLTAATHTGTRRLDDPADFVRLEIAKALERNVRVIPVLVGSAAVPTQQDLPPGIRPLALRHAMDLRDAHFHEDAQKLIQVIGTDVLGTDVLNAAVPGSPAPPQRKLRPAAFVAPAALLLVAAVLGGALLLRRGNPTPSPAPQATAPQVNPAPSSVPEATPQPAPAASAPTLPSAFVAGAVKTAAKPQPAPAPSLAGDWTGVVTYDWQNAVYPETFHFEGDGTDISGTATLFRAPHAIRDLHLSGNHISFSTQSGTETPEGKIFSDTHNYKGVITGDTIQFSMLTDSQVDTHDIIHFTATRKLKK